MGTNGHKTNKKGKDLLMQHWKKKYQLHNLSKSVLKHLILHQAQGISSIRKSQGMPMS
jgi:hypothetical protein